MMQKNEILAAYHFRHACKEFDPTQKITDDDFQFILETARLSPSSFGFEPWHLLIVQDQKLRQKLKEGAWGATLKLDTASHFIVCLAMKPPLTRHDSPYILNFMHQVQHLTDEGAAKKAEYFKNFQITDFHLMDASTLFDWAAKQSYIPLANMMTTAAMLGIDSCPIEGFNQHQTNDMLSKEFGVDTTKYGVAWMAAFGYRKNSPGPKTRRPIDEIASWK